MQHKNEIEYYMLLREHSDVINQVAAFYGHGDRHYIQELKQEISYALWKQFHKFGKFKHNKRYTDRECIINLAIKVSITYYYRYRYKFPIVPISALIEQLPIEENHSQLDGVLSDLVATLGLKDQRLIFYSLQQYSYAQIADIEDMTETAVGTRMSRILKKLREQSKKM